MASAEDLLEPLRPQLLALDDDTLAAAASKGLVRRAHKELEKAPDPTLTANGDCLTLSWPDHTVTCPTTHLLAATCTCPAADLCRHILLSVLWLRTHCPSPASQPSPASPHSPAPDTPPPPPSQIPAYTLEDLTRWATKATLRDGFSLLQRESPQVEGSDPIVVQFPQANLSCRYFGATGLTGMLCACKARQVCSHQVAAVLAILRSQGTALSLPESAAVDQGDAAVAAAAIQVITNAQTLLEQTITLGLLHLSEISHQQFVTLAVSAQGAKLPRLSLALRSIASEIDLHLNRNAAAESDRLLDRMAHTYALCAALQSTAPAYPVHLAGQAQSQYDDVGTLELIGLGAYPWRTASGYGGLTVLFWDTRAHRWCSWSESRPLFHRQHFNPSQVYLQPGPWEGIAHPAEASQSCLRLSNARRNYQQRLSSTSQTQGTSLRPTQAADWQAISLCFQNWDALRHHLASRLPVGLAEPNPLDRVVILRPHRWGPRQFDAVQQQLTWVLFDLQDQPLMLRLPFAATQTAALEHLEQLDPTDLDGCGIVSAISLEPEALYGYPIALCRATDTEASAILNLHFPAQPQENTTALPPPEPEPTAAASTALSNRALDHLTLCLQRLAERGGGALSAEVHADLAQLANHFEKVGLTTLTGAIATLLQSPPTQSAQLLKIRYLCQLLQQTEFRLKIQR